MPLKSSCLSKRCMLHDDRALSPEVADALPKV